MRRADKVQKAAALIGGAEWDAALKRFLPEDETGMTPLFAAIAHGCAAEREAEALARSIWPRIARGNERFRGELSSGFTAKGWLR